MSNKHMPKKKIHNWDPAFEVLDIPSHTSASIVAYISYEKVLNIWRIFNNTKLFSLVLF